MEQWKKAWSDESHSLLSHVDGWVCVCPLPEEEMTPGCTTVRKQAREGTVTLWEMFCWELLGPGIGMDATLTCNSYLNIAADQGHPFYVQWYTLMTVASGSRIMPPAKIVQKWFVEHDNSRC